MSEVYECLEEWSAARHPSVRQVIRWFDYRHLADGNARAVSAAIADLAGDILAMIPGDDPELTVGLRKLLEAKDAFARAAIMAAKTAGAPDGEDGQRFALVEQMGYRSLTGAVRETQFCGRPMLEVTPLDDSPGRLIGAESLYSLTWLTREQAERQAGLHRAAIAVNAWTDPFTGTVHDEDDPWREAGIDATPEMYDQGGEERDYDSEGNEL